MTFAGTAEAARNLHRNSTVQLRTWQTAIIRTYSVLNSQLNFQN